MKFVVHQFRKVKFPFYVSEFLLFTNGFSPFNISTPSLVPEEEEKEDVI